MAVRERRSRYRGVFKLPLTSPFLGDPETLQDAALAFAEDASFYSHTKFSFQPNQPRATAFALRGAVDEEDAKCQFILGVFRYQAARATDGASDTIVDAFHWLRKAVIKGNIQAREFLRSLMFDVSCVRWMRVAARNGSAEAVKHLSDLEKKVKWRCHACGKAAGSLDAFSPCDQCRAAHYCSTECRSLANVSHFLVCRPSQPFTE